MPSSTQNLLPDNNDRDGVVVSKVREHQARRLHAHSPEPDEASKTQRTVDVLKSEVLALQTILLRDCSGPTFDPQDRKPHACPVHQCRKKYTHVEHLNRHYRGVRDPAHQALARIISQKYCVECHSAHSRTSDLVRHEHHVHKEFYHTRVDQILKKVVPRKSALESEALTNIDICATAAPSSEEESDLNNRRQCGASQVKSNGTTSAAPSDPSQSIPPRTNRHTTHNDDSGHSVPFATSNPGKSLHPNRGADVAFGASPFDQDISLNHRAVSITSNAPSSTPRAQRACEVAVPGVPVLMSGSAPHYMGRLDGPIPCGSPNCGELFSSGDQMFPVFASNSLPTYAEGPVQPHGSSCEADLFASRDLAPGGIDSGSGVLLAPAGLADGAQPYESSYNDPVFTSGDQRFSRTSR